MMDDKFDSNNSTWMRNRWQIAFNGVSNNEYSIMHFNYNNGVLSSPTYAIDPLSKSDMNTISLDDKYSVTLTLTSSAGAANGSCQGLANIVFDNLGRPHVGDTNNDITAYDVGQLMTSTCTITLTNGTQTAIINIEPETGYTHRI